MNLNVTVNEAECAPPAPASAARVWLVRVLIAGVSGEQVNGPFTWDEVASVAAAFAARENVTKIVVEEVQ